MKAILISGIETVSEKESNIVSDLGINNLSFYLYLKYEVRLSEEDIFFYDGKDVLNLRAKGLLTKIGKIIAFKDPLEPLLIYYGGHGFGGEWSIYTQNRHGIRGFELKHKNLRLVLEKQRGPLIVVADCCFAMSLKNKLRHLNCKWLLLGLAPEDRPGYLGDVRGSINGHKSVLIQIMKSWSKRMPADPSYFNGNKMVRYLKTKNNRGLNYCLYMGNDKKFRKFYFTHRITKTRIVLREGDNLDYLMYPKK
ncbi:MAG: hypothetical protein AAB626_01080 [Patescibacteria group bacterium]